MRQHSFWKRCLLGIIAYECYNDKMSFNQSSAFVADYKQLVFCISVVKYGRSLTRSCISIQIHPSDAVCMCVCVRVSWGRKMLRQDLSMKWNDNRQLRIKALRVRNDSIHELMSFFVYSLRLSFFGILIISLSGRFILSTIL